MGSRNFGRIFPSTVTLMLLILLLPSMASAEGKSFTDVKWGVSHYEAIMALTEAKIINGYNDGRFGYNDKLTRQHGAVLFHNALEPEVPSDIESHLQQYYDDVNKHSMYASEIAAVTPNVFSGSGKTFNPSGNLTREQMATTIVKAFELEDTGTDPGMNLRNVDPSHQENVKILAQYNITNQLEDFQPKGTVTRAQFATFLYLAMVEKGLLDKYIVEEPKEPEKPTEPKPEEPKEPEKPEEPSGSVAYKTVSYDVSFSAAMDKQKSQKVDGAGQFEASRELIEYFANPNTFSKDSPEFFQFLSLAYTDGLSAKNINDNVLKGKGVFEGTAAAFIEAGKQNGVDVFYLIAHALHETGNGKSQLSTGHPVSVVDGKKVTEKKTYNMYGVAAYDSCPLRCGSEYAYKEGWFTPEAAIIGGAKFITNGYISRGQDTLYKMRWNPSSPGYPQYATHVEWAVIQARQIYQMYKDSNLLNTSNITFEIPEYKNQPKASSKPTGEKAYAISTRNKGKVYQTAVNLNMRQYPGTGAGIIVTLQKGTKVTVVGENGGWYKISANGQTGWVSYGPKHEYLIQPDLLEVVNVNNPSTLYVRSASNNKSTPIGSVRNGNTVVGMVDSKGNFIIENDYYKVSFNGSTGWIHGNYLKAL